jgi:DNA replication initiation complex subunit (GINS family)
MENEVIITYETLYDLLRNEKNKSELQQLSANFLKDLINYLNKKQEILESQEKKKSIFTSTEVQKTRKQIESIQKIIKELYERRESKIIQSCLISSRTNIESEETSRLLPEEQEFHKILTKNLNHYRENILYRLSAGQLPNIDIPESKPKDLKTNEKPIKTARKLKMICDIPKFVGMDMESYGPFNDKQIIEIPNETADFLIKQNKAEEI